MGYRALRSGAAAVVALLATFLTAPAVAGEAVELSVDVTKTGAKIDRNIFGQFAEHLGSGVYEGLWVGSGSTIPNTRGIRNDVLAALKALRVPNIRWPGGCYADDYHWRKGIGPADRRGVTLNPSWGGVIEPNSFGTHEFMDLLDQIGSDAYLSVNVGSGTPQEAAEWLEYLTSAETTLAKERAANGHAAPYKVPYLGIGNESWDCGGNMTADYYLSQLKIYSRFVRNFNPAQQERQQMLKIAVGPGGGEARWTDWTETIMKAYQKRQWSWDIQGLSLHSYTVSGWPPAFASIGFGESEYARVLKITLGMDELVAKHSAIMDTYDPEKKVALVVDEWGAWYAPLPGYEPGLSGPAEHAPRRPLGGAQPEHLRPPRRPRADGQHRPDDQRAAGHDPDGQGQDGPDADLPRLRDVPAVPGRDLRPGRLRRRRLRTWRRHPAARRCHRGQGHDRQALARPHQRRPPAPRRDRGEPGGLDGQVGQRRDPDRAEGRQRQHLRRPAVGRAPSGVGQGPGWQAELEPRAQVGHRRLGRVTRGESRREVQTFGSRGSGGGSPPLHRGARIHFGRRV